MSKPISISFGKPKTKATAASSHSILAPPSAKKPALTADPDDGEEEEQAPAHQSVLGFASDGGAILSTQVPTKEEKVIGNKGNADWRTRGRPSTERWSQEQQEQQQQQHRQSESDTAVVGTVDRDEPSKDAGLQYAQGSTSNSTATTATAPAPATASTLNGFPPHQPNSDSPAPAPESVETADQAALSALLHGHLTKTSPNTTISIQDTQPQPRTVPGTDDVLTFREDVASRPDSSTISDYAVMPVEEFGMALLRGMGKKRRANGEVIVIKNPNEPESKEDEEKRRRTGRERDPNAGFLGIGAKAVKITGVNGAEDGLGAWGKADMRKAAAGGAGAKAGEGLYTPVMLRDRRTGELMTEMELEERKRAAREKERKLLKGRGGREARDEEDWRERRERNLDRNGRERERRGDDRRDRERDMEREGEREEGKDGYRERVNGFSRQLVNGSRRENGSPRRSSTSRANSPSRESRRERDREEKDRNRDRDRDRDRERSRERDRERDRDGRRDRHRHHDKSDDPARYEAGSSSSSRRNGRI